MNRFAKRIEAEEAAQFDNNDADRIALAKKVEARNAIRMGQYAGAARKVLDNFEDEYSKFIAMLEQNKAKMEVEPETTTVNETVEPEATTVNETIEPAVKTTTRKKKTPETEETLIAE